MIFLVQIGNAWFPSTCISWWRNISMRTECSAFNRKLRPNSDSEEINDNLNIFYCIFVVSEMSRGCTKSAVHGLKMIMMTLYFILHNVNMDMHLTGRAWDDNDLMKNTISFDCSHMCWWKNTCMKHFDWYKNNKGEVNGSTILLVLLRNTYMMRLNHTNNNKDLESSIQTWDDDRNKNSFLKMEHLNNTLRCTPRWKILKVSMSVF